MPRPASSHPTEVELSILTFLWENGPSPVRAIHKQLSAERSTNYSTTVKMLGIMLEKGLVTRTEGERPHVYRAKATRRKTQSRMLADLIHRLYDDSAASLIMQALSTKSASPDELAQIKTLIQDIEKEKK